MGSRTGRLSAGPSQNNTSPTKFGGALWSVSNNDWESVTAWLTTRALPATWFLRCRLQRLVWPRAGRGRLVKLFNDPLPQYGALLDALRPRDSAELPSFSRLQLDAQRRAPCAYKNGFSSFFQILFKVCQIVRVPELRQLFNGISVWRLLPFGALCQRFAFQNDAALGDSPLCYWHGLIVRCTELSENCLTVRSAPCGRPLVDLARTVRPKRTKTRWFSAERPNSDVCRTTSQARENAAGNPAIRAYKPVRRQQKHAISRNSRNRSRKSKKNILCKTNALAPKAPNHPPTGLLA